MKTTYRRIVNGRSFEINLERNTHDGDITFKACTKIFCVRYRHKISLERVAEEMGTSVVCQHLF